MKVCSYRKKGLKCIHDLYVYILLLVCLRRGVKIEVCSCRKKGSKCVHDLDVYLAPCLFKRGGQNGGL